MNRISHSPAPWRSVPSSSGLPRWEIFGPDSELPIAIVPCSRAEQSSNAALIRKAPEIAKLLSRLREWDHMDSAGDGRYWKDEILSRLLDTE